MKAEAIVLKWKRKDKEYFKEIDRKKMFDLMHSIKETFEYDNTISSFFCEIMPEVDSISINYDRIDSMDIPVIEYEVGGKEKILEILRHHKIIWAILNGLTA